MKKGFNLICQFVGQVVIAEMTLKVIAHII